MLFKSSSGLFSVFTSGEVNTASNKVGGEGVFSAKVGTDLEFKSLTAGAGVSLASDTNEIVISASGGGGGGQYELIGSVTTNGAPTYDITWTYTDYTSVQIVGKTIRNSSSNTQTELQFYEGTGGFSASGYIFNLYKITSAGSASTNFSSVGGGIWIGNNHNMAWNDNSLSFQAWVHGSNETSKSLMLSGLWQGFSATSSTVMVGGHFHGGKTAMTGGIRGVRLKSTTNFTGGTFEVWGQPV